MLKCANSAALILFVEQFFELSLDFLCLLIGFTLLSHQGIFAIFLLFDQGLNVVNKELLEFEQLVDIRDHLLLLSLQLIDVI